MARKHGVGDVAVMETPKRVHLRNDWMPGLRIRHDGWTQAQTQRFLDTLGYSGCVRDAAHPSTGSNRTARLAISGTDAVMVLVAGSSERRIASMPGSKSFLQSVRLRLPM